jgi:hypothetical protein
MSYRVASRGVIDLTSGDPVQPGSARWVIYEAWLAAGGVPEPRIVPQEEIDAAAEVTAREAARTTLKADATITYLRTHTPAECAAYVNANVTDLASAKAVLSKIAMVVAYLARERLNQ